MINFVYSKGDLINGEKKSVKSPKNINSLFIYFQADFHKMSKEPVEFISMWYYTDYGIYSIKLHQNA